MRKEMCKQKRVIEKIKKTKKNSGWTLDLAEAQMADYIALKRDVDAVKSDVSAIKTEQAIQGGKLDLIIQRLNSPVEKERLDGQKWNLLTSIAKNKSAWVILIVMLISFALAGNRLVNILERLI